MGNSVGRSGVLIVLACALSACQIPFYANQKKQPAPAPAPVVQPKPVITKEQQVVKMLILNGEYTLSQNQLLTPTNENSPVAKAIEKRGEGLHHIGYRVNGIPFNESMILATGAARFGCRLHVRA